MRGRAAPRGPSDRDPLADPRIAAPVFFPRPDMPYGPADDDARDHAVPVGGGVTLRLREFPADDDAPAILFFHGNGETARDYDGMAPARATSRPSARCCGASAREPLH